MREAILRRISTRTYKNKPLSTDEIRKIQKILQDTNRKGPFQTTCELTFNVSDSNDINGKKIGTYGLIKNIQGFIGGVATKSRESLIDFGYVFEHVILELTTYHFSTCWLGGTFKRKDYRKKLHENTIIPAICPVGHRAEKRSFIDRSLRSSIQSQTRLQFHELFKNYKDESKLAINLLDPVIDSLFLVRKGPSASNKQPWRGFYDIENKMVHFYLKRTPNYARMLNYDIQLLDIGIALKHFEVGLDHHKVIFERELIKSPKNIDSMEYIITYKLSK